MKKADTLFLELCEEVDYWRSEAKRWEGEYKQERDAHIQRVNEQLKNSMAGIGVALTLALSVKDNMDGSLSISKEDRTRIAKSIKGE